MGCEADQVYLKIVSDPECWRQREQKGVSGVVLALKNCEDCSGDELDLLVANMHIQRKYTAVVAGAVAEDSFFVLEVARQDHQHKGSDDESEPGARQKKRDGRRASDRETGRQKYASSIATSGTVRSTASSEKETQVGGDDDGAHAFAIAGEKARPRGSSSDMLPPSPKSVGRGAGVGRQQGGDVDVGGGHAGWGTWTCVVDRDVSPECQELCIVEMWAGWGGEGYVKVDRGVGDAVDKGVGGGDLGRWGGVFPSERNTGVAAARQMRRAMAAGGHPVVGQRAVGKCRQLDDCRGTYLCCTALHFVHPDTGLPHTLTYSPPSKFRTLLERHSRSMRRQQERERERRGGAGVGEGEETGGVRKVVFCSLELETDARVFVPRVGTAEVVVRRAQELVSLLISANLAAGATELKRVRVLDLGTGTGCLLLATMIGGEEGAASNVRCVRTCGAGGGGHAEGGAGTRKRRGWRVVVWEGGAVYFQARGTRVSRVLLLRDKCGAPWQQVAIQ
jgi:hypothetical protein